MIGSGKVMPAKFSFFLRAIAVLVLVFGISISLYFGQTLEKNAKQDWYNQAIWTAEKATDTCLSWFTIQQTQLRAVAALFYSSEIVTENKFLDNLDLTEVPGSLPLHSIVYATQITGSDDPKYRITFSSSANTIFSPGLELLRNNHISAGIQTAKRFGGEVVMGPPFKDPQGRLLFSLLITAPNSNREGVLIATINLLDMIGDLATLHVPYGLHLQAIQMNSMADSSLRDTNFFRAAATMEEAAPSFHIRVDSGKAHMDFLWVLSSEFLGGPAIGLGRLVQIAGCLFNLFLFAVLVLLVRENVRVSRKVETRTAELTTAVDTIHLEVIEKSKAEKALKETIERFKALSDASFEAIFLSENGFCTDLNKTAERMFGYSREEALGAHASLIFPPEYSEKVIISIESEDGSPYEVMGLRKDGSQFPVLLRGRTIDHFDRKVRVTAISDITDRRQAEMAMKESEEKYRTLIDTTSTGFLVVDFSGNVLEANEEYAKILECGTAEDIIGRNVIEWTAKHDQERNKTAIEKCLLSGQCSNLTIDYLTMEIKLSP